MLPLAWRPLWLAGALALALSIVVASLVPAPLVEAYAIDDKLGHAAAYLMLTLWLTGIVERRRYPLAALIALVMGALLELVQGLLTPTRYAELLDLAANAVGIVLALALAYLAFGGWAARVEAWLGVGPTH